MGRADTLGSDHVLAATAVSPSLAADELTDCAALAGDWGIPWVEVATDELRSDAYQRNDGDRCYWCKDALMEALGPIARERGATVVLGVNLDDLGDHRPGQRAAAERGAAFPLVDAGFTKAAVRDASRRLGLRTWDKPAAACLASRVPYGTTVTVSVLGRGRAGGAGVARARLSRAARPALRRHRPYRGAARVARWAARGAGRRRRRGAARVGYRYVTVDLEGLRSGNLNEALRPSR